MKTISAVTSAALLASVLATSAVATMGTAGQSDQTNVLDCGAAVIATAATCSQVADGISTVTLVGDDDDGTAGGYTTYISASGATIIAAGGQFVLGGGIVTAPLNADLNDLTDTITLRAPSAAGSATVSVYQISTTTGIAALEGTLTITFTATSGLAVSEANSTVKFVAAADACSATALATNAADKATNPAAKLCVLIKDGNSNPITTATVAMTITPVGLAVAALSDGTDATAGTAQAASTATNTVAGSYAFGIGGSNLAGVATIGISVTVGSTTTTFAPKTFTFSGGVASIVATGGSTVVATSGTKVGAITFVAKDAAGNAVATTGSTVVTTGTVYTAPANGAAVTTEATSADAGAQTVICGATAGSGTIAIKNGTVTSNAITVYCSGAADTYSVAFDKLTVVPGGQATITVTVKDAGGRPAPDGLAVTILPSAGAVLATTAGVTKNGVATWTFLAPFNTGVVTVLASATVATSSSPQSASINVSAPVSVGIGGIASSALGVTRVGPFTAATKLPALGKYVSVKMSLGTAAAGETIEIWRASKNSAGVWSAFTKLTARVADASGNVYFFHRSYSAAWLSFYGVLGADRTNSSQARWR